MFSNKATNHLEEIKILGAAIIKGSFIKDKFKIDPSSDAKYLKIDFEMCNIIKTAADFVYITIEDGSTCDYQHGHYDSKNGSAFFFFRIFDHYPIAEFRINATKQDESHSSLCPVGKLVAKSSLIIDYLPYKIKKEIENNHWQQQIKKAYTDLGYQTKSVSALVTQKREKNVALHSIWQPKQVREQYELPYQKHKDPVRKVSR